MHGIGPAKGLVDGALIVEAKADAFLAALGVEPVPAVSSRFDPRVHQVLEIRGVAADLDGIVLEEVVRGYRLGERVLRHSQVVVGKADPAGPPQ